MGREPKFKVGDRVRFRFNDHIWVGTITGLYEYPSGWNYKIYDFWHNEWDIIGKEE